MSNNIAPISGTDFTCPNCADLNALVITLRKRIEDLEADLEQRDEEFVAVEERMSRAREKASRLERSIAEQAREADYAELFRSTTVGEINRARERGDNTAVERGLEKLKRGW